MWYVLEVITKYQGTGLDIILVVLSPRLYVDNVTYYDKVSLRMSFIGYQAPNVGHILWHAVTLIWHSFDTVQQPAR